MSAAFAITPALPLHAAGKYVAGAYIVFVVLVLIYVGIMALRLSRTQRDLVALKREVEEAAKGDAAEREPDLERVG